MAVRFLCANHHPDHDSICTFRRGNQAAFQAAFVTVLQLAHQLRLTRVGSVSMDGTKLQANASKHAAVSYQRAGELITRFQLEVAELTTRAEQADVKEAQEPLDIPAELARREKRIESLTQARQIIEAQARERAAAQQAEHQAKVAARQAQRDAGKKPRGPEPKAPDDKPAAKDQYNFTDPESRIMKAGNGKHFEQAYNAQAAVDEAMLIVGQRVSVAANDKQELAANVAAISPVVKEAVKAVLADSGFYSEAMVQAKLTAESQCHPQTHQTGQNTNGKTVNDSSLPGSPSNDEGYNQRQQHLKPRHQLGTDPRGKVINGALVGSAPSLKSQDKRIDGNNDHQDEETRRNNCNRSAENAKPSDTR